MKIIKGMRARKTEYYNALADAFYYKQVIVEICDADLEQDYFRRTRTIGECEVYHEIAEGLIEYVQQNFEVV